MQPGWQSSTWFSLTIRGTRLWRSGHQVSAWSKSTHSVDGRASGGRIGSRGDLDISTEKGDPASQYIPERVVKRRTSTPENFQQIRSWLHDCANKQRDHQSCMHPPPSFVPTRLVKILDDNTVVIHSTLGSESIKWVALTYCWGGELPVKLTKDTIDNWMFKGFLINQLPKTIQDAVETTRKLGMDFVWIDCLCIIQDDEEDMNRELSRIGQVFWHAQLTISAARAPSSDDGFLHDLTIPPPIDAVFRFHYKAIDGTMGTVIAHVIDDWSPPKEPIEDRAWTLQEHMMSPRLLVFSSRDIRWTCGVKHRIGTGNTRAMLSEKTFVQQSLGPQMEAAQRRYERRVLGDDWATLLLQYTGRKMTYRKDVLTALSGMAAMYSIQRKDVYLAGHFKSNLFSSLLWNRDPDYGPLMPRPQEYVAPSWSWASIVGRVAWIGMRKPTSAHLKLLDFSLEPVSHMVPFGGLKSGRLLVEGRLKQATWSADRTSLYEPDGSLEARKVANTIADADEHGTYEHSTTVWCLEVCAYATLEDFLYSGQGPKDWSYDYNGALNWNFQPLGPTKGLVLSSVDGQVFRPLGMFICEGEHKMNINTPPTSVLTPALIQSLSASGGWFKGVGKRQITLV